MLERHLKISQNQTCFILGPRNTGKSTLIKTIFKDSFFIDFLDFEQEELFSKNPKELKYICDAFDGQYIVIDEVQKVPKILDTVHQLIENTEKIFILTGSSARKIKKGASNLLAGRAFIHYLHPFSYLELGLDFKLEKALKFGMLPKTYHYESDEMCIEFLRSYTNTYLKEEIWAEQFIRKLDPFRKFLEVAGQMNGKIVNYSKISDDIGVDDKTIKEYFIILEDTLVGFFLHGFQHSFRKRLLSKPKFYFFDIGVKRSICRELSIPVEKSTYQYGNLFEHFIILECKKLASYFKKDFEFSYLMTKDGLEIDLVVERPGEKTLFIEIKSKADITERDLKELRFIKDDFKDGEFICLCDASYKKMIEGIKIYPWAEGIKKYFC
ncbi:MAG: hypothetical protein FADNKDHG_01596 [Holosporales bacterium]